MVLKPRGAIIASVFSTLFYVSHAIAAEPAGHAWYIDCAAHNETADGRSPATAWKSTRAASTHRFRPGDSILFRRGSVCHGMLAPKGSGTPTAPIRLGAFGTGPLPRIGAEQGDEAALKLFDQEYWTIEDLGFSGGEPHGVFISGTKGVLHGIHIRNIVVHDVSGNPKTKEDGLLVIASGKEEQHFDDVVIDGVTAYDTSEWAGILVGGVARGFPPETSRNTNVVIRNSIAHDVAGDGIVLFETNSGRIENSIAWRTGMQETETIGTPNAIWTWMCRNCSVRRNEAFLTDSPGVDGGAFDIDYGNNDNVVEENYGHDTQGYCVAVFGAGWVTENSLVRNNVCSANGLSPRLARRQGAIFLSTWNAGKIRDLEISGNRIFWNPPLATAAVVNVADLQGKSTFERNYIRSESPVMTRSNSSLSFDKNSMNYCGHGDESACPRVPERKVENGWRLSAIVSASREDHDSRGEVAMMESIHAQFPGIRLRIVIDGKSIPDKNDRENLQYDWNTGNIPMSFDDEQSQLPALALTDPSGKVVWRHEGFTPPGELGPLLRSLVANPEYAKMPTSR